VHWGARRDLGRIDGVLAKREFSKTGASRSNRHRIRAGAVKIDSYVPYRSGL
jgi:hypothetical protein